MILQSLYELQRELVKQGKLDKLGWSQEKVKWAVNIDNEGNLMSIDSLEFEVVDRRTNKSNIIQPVLFIPTRVKRTANVAANFLVDTTAYIFGASSTKSNSRDVDCFTASKKLHADILQDVNSDFANALKLFYAKWDPKQADQNSIVFDKIDEISKGGNLIYQVNSKYIIDDSAICEAWSKVRSEDCSSQMGQCLVTGKRGKIARLHPNIKGVFGAQSSGASLVSYNAEAYESYGKKQGDNAPVSEEVAAAYGTALNYLIANQSQVVGDSTIVFWSRSSNNSAAAFFRESCFGSRLAEGLTKDDLQKNLFNLARGLKIEWGDELISPDEPFYILSLAPNSSRLSVRFFLVDSFGTFASNLVEHFQRLEIQKPKFIENESLSIGSLLYETVNKESRNKSPKPQTAGAFLKAVLQNYRYPETLFNEVQLRIKAEGGQISWRRAAMIKAYLLKNGSKEKIREVISTVKLNEDAMYAPYILGRVFATLEMIQKSANPGIKATIKDRYFNSACGTPSSVFPLLINLAQKHLKKISTEKPGHAINFNKLLGELFSRIDTELPKHLNMQDQGVFQLGYYHQTQSFYESKNTVDLEQERTN